MTLYCLANLFHSHYYSMVLSFPERYALYGKQVARVEIMGFIVSVDLRTKNAVYAGEAF